MEKEIIAPNKSKVEKDRTGDREASKPKKHRQPEGLIGAVAVESKPPNQTAEKVPEAKKPETSQLPDPQKAPEHIGHTLIFAEAKPIEEQTEQTEPEKTTSVRANTERSTEQPVKPITNRRVETLDRAELLSLSEKIVIDGSNLRQIYETHLVGERGLRRLVIEHLRGGDLKSALRREIIEREIDFERDPQMRDMNPQQMLIGTSISNPGKAALDELLKKAALTTNDRSEEAAFFKARAIYEANQLQQHKKQRRIIDISLAGLIAILLALIIFLFLRRG